VSILVDQRTRLLVQGITGREGTFHAERMRSLGTHVVAGVTPGRGGAKVAGVPVYDTVRQAVQARAPSASAVFVPAAWAADAILEAADAGVELVVAVTEGVPVHDMLAVTRRLECLGTTLLGPNCPGVVTPGQANVGIVPGAIVKPGPVGVVSRSGTLTYEVLNALTERGIGQSTAVGVGGDPIHGLGFVEVLEQFEADPETEVVVLIGEIGGAEEQAAAQFIAAHGTKPVVAFVAGRSAPPGRRMGHAGAIVSGGGETAVDKMEALAAAGAVVAANADDIADLVAERVASGQ
jgi:succinyl-CoA synthetase alpha subunit